MTYGNFYVGKGGFQYKKMGGGGNNRIPSLLINISSENYTIDNRYVAGSGVGGLNTSNRRALKRRASSSMTCCMGKNNNVFGLS
jgi:hypothetical protein